MASLRTDKTSSSFEDLFEVLFNCQGASGKSFRDRSRKQPITELKVRLKKSETNRKYIGNLLILLPTFGKMIPT